MTPRGKADGADLADDSKGQGGAVAPRGRSRWRLQGVVGRYEEARRRKEWRWKKNHSIEILWGWRARGHPPGLVGGWDDMALAKILREVLQMGRDASEVNDREKVKKDLI